MIKDSWDPLAEKNIEISPEIYASTLKRQIQNIIKSYTGWFDPLSELIQNALDSVDERSKKDKEYSPRLWIEINLKENWVCVTDNGIGFSQEQLTTFLRPNVSFKGEGTRGVKGVGATYLAYGFNFLQIGTKMPDYSYVGDLSGGREWVDDVKNVKPRPMVVPSHPIHDVFNKLDRGATFCLKFIGDSIRPRNLGWFGATTAFQWEVILRLKTPLGGIYLDRQTPETVCSLRVVKNDGTVDDKTFDRCDYLYPHKVISTCIDVREIVEKEKELSAKGRSSRRLASNFYQLNGIYSHWRFNEKNITPNGLPLRLAEEDFQTLRKFSVSVYGFFTYSTDVWDVYSDDVVGLRKATRILKGGLQMATNTMPQGELILIPLRYAIGYQHVTHVIVHFALAEPDLGRKGFQPELQQLSERVAVAVVNLFQDRKDHLKKKTGTSPDILEDKNIHDWKVESQQHEKEAPIIIKRQDVFLPTREIALTAAPVVEQDVIALFNQLLAGGVIRGIRLMAASQHKKYDGIWKACLKEPFENYLFDKERNPLGVELASPKEYESAPYVLEYKYTFDALLDEIDEDEKNQSSIDLVVCWEMGDGWKGKYQVTPLLHYSNLQHRSIHGITHHVQDAMSGQKVFMLVVLKELIDYINDPDAAQEYQKKTYMDT